VQKAFDDETFTVESKFNFNNWKTKLKLSASNEFNSISE
jgi:hypothetical protein